MFLGALAFGLPLCWLISQGHSKQAAFAGFGIIVSLFMDIGSTRRLRLESMLVGNVLIVCAAALSMAINDFWLPWLIGLVVLLSFIGSSLAAGFALDLKLRMLAAAYLVAYPGSLITSEILPMYLAGASCTMLLSTAFAPRMNNPIAAAITPHWRNDWLQLRAGHKAGITFGVFLGFACVSSFFAAHSFHLLAPNIAAVTTLMVFRPEPDRTSSTIWLRLIGVLLASILAWALVFPAASSWTLLGLAIVAGAFVPVAFANGLMYVAALITFIMYVLLALLGIHGHTAQHAAEMRVIETLLGALIAAFFAMIYELLNSKTTP
ncbi:FUSC family protein [Chitinibacter bivalviorum]|uniref:FUSC family protein n=1 Tax=Chitinibacter bivalviorum TaxID=2739434 RepID=A0A7H9BFP6_9NEIS|nr:FUSC family protein [Chitinibacter bivalviorum]QLG87530.1 FUSC family protein [Chitinibacter bivalviorum]